jgi:hypothetical protein
MGVVAISRELYRLGVKPRKGERWKGTRVLEMIGNPLYAGFIRWGGETAMGTHEPIIAAETFGAAQKTMHDRAYKTRQLRSPHHLAGLVRCGLCGAPMHVTYPGTEPKRRLKYYVRNNRVNHQSCGQDYIRADILGASIIREIAKLADRKDVLSALVAEHVAQNRKAVPSWRRSARRCSATSPSWVRRNRSSPSGYSVPGSPRRPLPSSTPDRRPLREGDPASGAAVGRGGPVH